MTESLSPLAMARALKRIEDDPSLTSRERVDRYRALQLVPHDRSRTNWVRMHLTIFALPESLHVLFDAGEREPLTPQIALVLSNLQDFPEEQAQIAHNAYTASLRRDQVYHQMKKCLRQHGMGPKDVQRARERVRTQQVLESLNGLSARRVTHMRKVTTERLKRLTTPEQKENA